MGGFLKCKKNSSRGRSGLLKILAERKQWELEEQKLAEIEKYFHTIRVKANDEDVLTLSGNEQKNGATLVIANRMKNDESQQWIYDMSTGKIKLEANPKFVVTLFLGSVVLWEDKNWPWQKWDFKDNKFTSKDSSKSVLKIGKHDEFVVQNLKVFLEVLAEKRKEMNNKKGHEARGGM